jgi:hypothetical protein
MDVRKLTLAKLRKRMRQISKLIDEAPEDDGLVDVAAKDTPVIKGLLAEAAALTSKKRKSRADETHLVVVVNQLLLFFALREMEIEEGLRKKVRRKRKGSA